MNKSSTPVEASPSIDRAFLNFIESHRRGSVISEISAAMKQAAAATQDVGKASKVVLTITMAPANAGTVGTLVLTTKVKTQCPEAQQHGSIFYADADFNLVREDPNQSKLPLRDVTVEQTPLTQGPSELKEVKG